MHGLVLLDNKKKLIRNSIIWCDSRSVNIGNKAEKEIGRKRCKENLLNTPGMEWFIDHYDICRK